MHDSKASSSCRRTHEALPSAEAGGRTEADPGLGSRQAVTDVPPGASPSGTAHRRQRRREGSARLYGDGGGLARQVRRGDIVTASAPGDYGKHRPAVVVQSDALNDILLGIVICPLTTDVVDAPLLRVSVEPTPLNGLCETSHVMVDKVQAVSRHRLRDHVGTLEPHLMRRVEESLSTLLGLP